MLTARMPMVMRYSTFWSSLFSNRQEMVPTLYIGMLIEGRVPTTNVITYRNVIVVYYVEDIKPTSSTSRAPVTRT